jgi:TPR repeat protein
VAVLAALWVGAPGVASADFDDGLEAYRAGDYERAMTEWRPLAEQGVAEAQFNVGLLYYQGRGVEQDHAEARGWYELAAEQGYARAQYDLAVLYAEGKGGRVDEVSAHVWFTLAGRQKYGDAKKRRKRLAKRMTPHEIAEAEMRVRHWERDHKGGD